eukprot:m.200024 g.200024  ORF g.200024 m.200024 type:complete len:240 (-) comp20935_c0_seq1:194-913(-)
MLAADKLLLQSRIRQNAIQLKEKEFTLHNSNFGTVGTQAAVIAGFTMTALVEISLPQDSNRVLTFFYFNLCTLSLCCNVYCVSQTTALAVAGTSLSLRGPDGSMIRAVDGMFAERFQVFRSFAIGLFSLLGGMFFGVIIIMGHVPEAAVSCTIVICYAIWAVYNQCKRVFERFQYDENDSTSFDDLLDLPMSLPRHAAQRVMGGVRDAAQLIRDRGGNDRNGEYDEQLLRGVNSDASYA